jgi:hypothetical protein
MAAENFRGAVHHEVCSVSERALEWRWEKGGIYGHPSAAAASKVDDSFQVDDSGEWICRGLNVDELHGSCAGSLHGTFVERIKAMDLDAKAREVLRHHGIDATVNVAAGGKGISRVQESTEDTVEGRQARSERNRAVGAFEFRDLLFEEATRGVAVTWVELTGKFAGTDRAELFSSWVSKGRGARKIWRQGTKRRSRVIAAPVRSMRCHRNVSSMNCAP